MKSFAELFKKYRLRAEFETFSSFGNVLSEKGYYYEDSIFSHWQKGTRIPKDRQVLLKILEIFIEREAIRTLDQANEFLASAGVGYLTEREEKAQCFTYLVRTTFQVPHEIADFIGREKTLKLIDQSIKNHNVILLYGPPGVGKTALAIKLGHALRKKYPDGILWYKYDSSNMMDILLSIARLFGEDISSIKNIDVRASIIRTLLSKRKVLLVLDNVTAKEHINLLIPNSSSCSVILTSREKKLNLDIPYTSVLVSVFTKDEALNLFTNVLGKEYTEKHTKEIVMISNILGNLPLGVHVAAIHINQFSLSPKEYMQQLSSNDFYLQDLTYEDRNLFKAITLTFDTLPLSTQNVFISLGVFEGKDFLIEAVSYINRISIADAEVMLHSLLKVSFIERSKEKRYRIHPLLKLFARNKIKDNSLYLRTALYYEKLLNNAQEKQSYKQLRQEVDNIIYIFKKCYELGYWDEIITLWTPIEFFLSYINETKKLHQLTQTIDTTPNINKVQKIITIFMVVLFIFGSIIAWSGIQKNFWNYLYGILWNTMPLFGGAIGMYQSISQKIFRTNVSKAKFFISTGLFIWGCGNLVWQYYNLIQKVEVPYPSFADFGYLSAAFLWIIGIIYLSRATGATVGFKKVRKKFLLLLAPTTIAACSYYFLLFVLKRPSYSDNPLKISLDLIYPSMDLIILTLILIVSGLSVNFFRGKYKASLFSIIVGFFGLFIADFMFSYMTTIGTYYNGCWLELFFNCTFYLLTWGTLSFYVVPRNKKLDDQII